REGSRQVQLRAREAGAGAGPRESGRGGGVRAAHRARSPRGRGTGSRLDTVLGRGEEARAARERGRAVRRPAHLFQGREEPPRRGGARRPAAVGPDGTIASARGHLPASAGERFLKLTLLLLVAAGAAQAEGNGLLVGETARLH